MIRAVGTDEPAPARGEPAICVATLFASVRHVDTSGRCRRHGRRAGLGIVQDRLVQITAVGDDVAACPARASTTRGLRCPTTGCCCTCRRTCGVSVEQRRPPRAGCDGRSSTLGLPPSGGRVSPTLLSMLMRLSDEPSAARHMNASQRYGPDPLEGESALIRSQRAARARPERWAYGAGRAVGWGGEPEAVRWLVASRSRRASARFLLSRLRSLVAVAAAAWNCLTRSRVPSRGAPARSLPRAVAWRHQLDGAVLRPRPRTRRRRSQAAQALGQERIQHRGDHSSRSPASAGDRAAADLIGQPVDMGGTSPSEPAGGDPLRHFRAAERYVGWLWRVRGNLRSPRCGSSPGRRRN